MNTTRRSAEIADRFIPQRPPRNPLAPIPRTLLMPDQRVDNFQRPHESRVRQDLTASPEMTEIVGRSIQQQLPRDPLASSQARTKATAPRVANFQRPPPPPEGRLPESPEMSRKRKYPAAWVVPPPKRPPPQQQRLQSQGTVRSCQGDLLFQLNIKVR